MIHLLALVVALGCGNAAACSSGGATAARPYDAVQESKKVKTKNAKTPKVDKPAPDEGIEDEVESDGSTAPAGTPEKPGTFVWKQHPSLRFGKAVRLDFEAKFQEDWRESYSGGLAGAGQDPWELHRNRVGVKGRIGKHIDYYPCDFKWRDQVARNIGIRSRGTGSRSGSKPGLRVDFDRFTAKQTFLGTLKSFILRNQTQDGSNMHERISMLLFQRLGVPAMRETFAKVYVNNAFAGLYTIVESPDKAYLDRIYGDNDGYLYKYDYNAGDSPWFFQSSGDDPALYVPHPFKPETHEDDPRPEFVRNFIRIASTDSDAAWRLNLDSYVNWENFAKHIAVESFIADQDGFNGDYGVNNFYWYRWTNRNLFTWIPWDKSEAFKNAPTQNIFHNFLEGDPARRNRLSARAMTLDDVRNLYLDALLALATSAAERDSGAPDDARGWMEREIDREYQQIRDLVYSDTEKPFTNAQFEEAVDSLRTFARIRPGNVQAQVNAFRQR